MELTDKDLGELEVYLEGALSEAEKRQFEEKMEDNKALKDEYLNRLRTKQIWIEANEFTEEKEKIKLILSDENKSNNQQILWQSIAAAAVLILMVGSYFYLNHNNTNSSDPQIADKKTENTLLVDKPISYAKLKTYTKLELLSPINHQEISQDQAVLFKWRGLDKKDSLSVFNNNEVVFKHLLKPMDSTFTLPAHKLITGRYYWQISDKKETFIIGK